MHDVVRHPLPGIDATLIVRVNGRDLSFKLECVTPSDSRAIVDLSDLAAANLIALDAARAPKGK